MDVFIKELSEIIEKTSGDGLEKNEAPREKINGRRQKEDVSLSKTSKSPKKSHKKKTISKEKKNMNLQKDLLTKIKKKPQIS